MALRLISAANGFVHDIDRISVLSDEACNLRLLSDRTLYILQNLSGEDITFLNRYGQIEENGEYLPVQSGTTQADTVGDAVDIIRRDLTDMSCETLGLQITAAISSLTSAILATSCGCEVGQGEDTSDGERGGSVPPPIGDIVFEEPAAVADRDCKSANLLHFTLRDLFVELDAFNVDDMGILGLVLVIGTISGIIASVVATPMIGIVVGVAGAIAAFAARLIGITVSLSNIVSAFNAGEENLICILFASSTASAAKADYLVELEANGATSLEADLVGLMMTFAFMDILYFDTPETAAFWPTYTPPFDCATCTNIERIELLEFGGGGDQGLIIGSNKFQVGDTVVVQSVDEPIGCPGRELIAMNLLTAGGLALHANVTVTITGWADFCIHAACPTNVSLDADELDFGGTVNVTACSVEPDGVFPDLSSYAPRSDDPFEITMLRTA